jgi:flagellar motor protein MotB
MRTGRIRNFCSLPLTTGLLAYQFGCGPTMLKSPVTQTVVEVLQTEDKTWQEICSALGQSDHEAGPKLLDNYQIQEAINDVKALHEALRTQKAPLPDCSALKTSTSQLDAAAKCLTELRKAWNQADADAEQLAGDALRLADNAKKLFEIVQATIDDPETAVRDLTRQLNFSLVVLVRLAEIAQVSEQTIDDVTESLGWWSAAVRIPLKLVVAEVLVRLNEFVMMEIERLGWITPSDTARNSCNLLQQGTYRTTVQTRLLRRTVLRFGERSDAGACEPKAATCALRPTRKASGVEGLCRQIDEEGNDVCRRALRKLRVPHREISETFDPTYLLANKSPNSEESSEGIQKQAEAILAAAPVCEKIDSSMRCLSDVASIFIYAPTTVWKDGPLDPSVIHALRVQLSEMRGAVGSMHAEMRRSLNQLFEDNRTAFDSIHQLERLVSGPLTRKIEAALVERCAADVGDIQTARIEKTRKMFDDMVKANDKTPPPLACPASPSTEPYDLERDGVRVVVDYQAMCNAFESSYVTFTVEGAALFKSCSCNLSDNPQGGAVARNLASLIKTFVDADDVAKLEVIGHSDPSGIESPCSQCNGVNENDQLSKYRADAFAQEVKNNLAGHSANKVESRGVGSTQPLEGKRCSIGDKDCYAKNRRIEARLFLSEGSIDPQACVSKPVTKSSKKK